MMSRYRQVLCLAFIWGVAPVLVGFYLHDFLAAGQVGSASEHSVNELPVYHGVKAAIYSPSGRLDYHLRADALMMQADAGSYVYRPTVNLASGNFGTIDTKSLKNQNVQIQSEQAHISAADVSFSRDVAVMLSADKGGRQDTRMIRADQLRYTVGDQFFVAQGGVHYCHGIEEIFASKLSGVISDDDFVFEKGRVVFKKQPGC